MFKNGPKKCHFWPKNGPKSGFKKVSKMAQKVPFWGQKVSFKKYQKWPKKCHFGAKNGLK